MSGKDELDKTRRSALKSGGIIGAGLIGSMLLGSGLPAASATTTQSLPLTWPDPSNSSIYLKWNITNQLTKVLNNLGGSGNQTLSKYVLTLTDETGRTILAINRGGSGLGQLVVLGNKLLQGNGVPTIRNSPAGLTNQTGTNTNVISWKYATNRHLILGVLNVLDLSSGTILVTVTYTDETDTVVTETIATGNYAGKFPIAYWLWNKGESLVTVGVSGTFTGTYDLDIEPMDMF
jgi:hypothetical protein